MVTKTDSNQNYSPVHRASLNPFKNFGKLDGSRKGLGSGKATDWDWNNPFGKMGKLEGSRKGLGSGKEVDWDWNRNGRPTKNEVNGQNASSGTNDGPAHPNQKALVASVALPILLRHSPWHL